MFSGLKVETGFILCVFLFLFQQLVKIQFCGVYAQN